MTGPNEPDEDVSPAPTQSTCPRCGSARSRAATFCGVCGQDLRPGAPVLPLPPEPKPEPKPETAAKRRLGRRGAKPDASGAAAAAAATTASAAAPPPRMPGATASPKPAPLTPKPAPAVVPSEDTTLSFSERYRGTEYSNPDIDRYLPPAPGTKGAHRGRNALIGLVAVIALVAALGGGYVFFVAPSMSLGPGASGTDPAADASATPRPTPSPSPTINGLIPDEVEIAGCLLFAEDGQVGADMASLRQAIAAKDLAGVPGLVDALSQAIDGSRVSVAALESWPDTAHLAAAWLALYKAEAETLDAIKEAAGSGDEKAMKAAVARLKTVDGARAAVVAAQAALVETFPEATCVVPTE